MVPFFVVRPTDYSRALEAIRAAAFDAGRDPMSITPTVVRTVVTGRNRDDVDEALDSVIVKASALAVPAEALARHTQRSRRPSSGMARSRPPVLRVINGRLLKPSLRKDVAASLPHVQVLRGLKKL